MGALLSLPITLLNFLLPFTNAKTPLFQDLVHTVILCGTLYFAPQIAEWYHTQQAHTDTPAEQIDDTNTEHEPAQPERPTNDPPLDERLIFQDDDDTNNNIEPPPLAPTPPPPGAQHQARVDDDELPNLPQNDGFALPPDAAGPANDRPRPTPANRTVGAKKAKSLARKDQRRAYHEFHRQEAELRKLQEAEGAEEREAALQAERERRARIEEEIREKEREERERVKREREREAEEEAARRERCLERVKSEMQSRGAVDLVDEAWKEGKDRIWVERLVRASGLLVQLQREDGVHVMITGQGWLVKIDEQMMHETYREAEVLARNNDGKVSFAEMGGLLETIVRERSKA